MLLCSLIRIFLLYLLTSSITFSSNISLEDLQNTCMPFKLGFEFQEENNLCRWASNNEAIQKKPIFTCYNDEKEKMWHVVIDDKDIEFVLEPFSHEQKSLLDQAIQSVQLSCKSLSTLLKNGVPTYSIEDTEAALRMITEPNSILINKLGHTLYENFKNQGFRIWKNWASIEILREQYKDVEGLDLESQEIDNKLVKKWEDQTMTPLRTIIDIAKKRDKGFLPQLKSSAATFRGWIESIKFYDNQQLHIVKSDICDLVSTEAFTSTSSLKFQPQATVQYPLEYTIPLWFSLYSFNDDNPLIFKRLVHSLPSLDTVKAKPTIIKEDYQTKKVGLIFLHALTLNSMMSPLKDDHNLLIETLDRLEKTGQIDIKGKLSLMSRRPFSEMWAQVLQKDDSFVQEHEKYMIAGNNKFSKLVKEQFANTTYAEQYFDDESKQLKDLSPDLLSEIEENRVFKKEFIANNRDQIKSLIKKGIISTVMIRNFDPERVKVVNAVNQVQDVNAQKIFENYYKDSLSSIDKPSYRYLYDVRGKQIVQKSSIVDMLSPPLFLKDSDAMGLFQDRTHLIDPKYGEGIVEARMIKSVSKYFMQTMGIDVKAKGTFLTSPVNLDNDAAALFSFISQMKKISSSSEYYDGMLKCINNSIED